MVLRKAAFRCHRLAVAMVLVFFMAQVGALLHMAEYGFEKHHHAGQLCSAFVHKHQSGSMVPAVGAAVLSLTGGFFVNRFSYPAFNILSYLSLLPQARAPPVI